ncbi:uncharacterized protein [Arachis hypogaea]|uniref:uncharacterized protein isoform X2 n=1 Tax=Arachis hypogaea TaxID=3818 RepID=UPI000DEC64F5|nr:uncharacterized protein LOC112795787 isoform X2 [Arachis hypogaea]
MCDCGPCSERERKTIRGGIQYSESGNKISSDMPTTGALCLTPIIPTDGNVQLSEPPSDQEITALNEPLPSAMEVDTPICDDIKEKQDHIQHCTKTCSNQSEVEVLDATPLSSAVRTECLSESCTKSSPLASSGENMSDQPQVIPSCPLTPTVSKELDNEIVTKSCRQDVDTSSADEVEKIIDQSPDEPVDRSVLQQTSGSKAVANSSVDASQSVLVEEGTISETAILPSSSFSIDDNKVSSKTCAISNSETLEEAMEEGATDRSEFLPPEKGAEESCRNATEVPSTVPVLLQESIDSEGDHRDQGKSQVGGIPENHETGMLAAPKTSEGGNEVETFSDKGPLGSSDAWDESKGLADMENQTEAIQNHAAEIDVPCTSASGDKAKGEPKGLADMENQAEAIQNRSAEMDVLCLSASGVKAEGESKEVADMENRAEAIQNCAAEMDVPCTSAPGTRPRVNLKD